MARNEQLTIYSGVQPYIFISYAHADEETVMPIVAQLYNKGYKIWYDEGIEVGSEWQNHIAERLRDSELMIAFISEAYDASANCRKEMSYAISKHKKIINIFIENVQLSAGLEMQIGNTYAIIKPNYTEEEFNSKLYTCSFLNEDNFEDTVPLKKKQQIRIKTGKAEKQKKDPVRKAKIKKIFRIILLVILLLLFIAFLVTDYIFGYSSHIADFFRWVFRWIPINTSIIM